MELESILIPFIKANPKWKELIENATHQPVDYVMKSFTKMMDDIKNGPGIKNIEAERQSTFNYMYDAGLKMGFTDWESEIAAAAHAGYSPVDIAISFSRNRGWDATAEEIENISKSLAPRFNKKAEQYGIIRPKVEENGIPKVEAKTLGGQPPWRNKAEEGKVVNPLKSE